MNNPSDPNLAPKIGEELAKLIKDVSSRQTANASPTPSANPTAPNAASDTIDFAANLKNAMQVNGQQYWNAKGLTLPYSTGYFMGKNVVSFDAFLKNFVRVFENSVRMELEKKSETSEEYDADFKMLQYAFTMIVNHLKANKFEFSSPSFVAMFHGLINSSLDNVK